MFHNTGTSRNLMVPIILSLPSTSVGLWAILSQQKEVVEEILSAEEKKAKESLMSHEIREPCKMWKWPNFVEKHEGTSSGDSTQNEKICTREREMAWALKALGLGIWNIVLGLLESLNRSSRAWLTMWLIWCWVTSPVSITYILSHNLPFITGCVWCCLSVCTNLQWFPGGESFWRSFRRTWQKCVLILDFAVQPQGSLLSLSQSPASGTSNKV